MCNLELGDYFAAKDALNEIPMSTHDMALTWYIRFRIDVRHATDDVVLSTVEELVKAEGFHASMLYHCAVEAQANNRNKVALPLLTRVLDGSRQSTRNEMIHMPALLRCIIKLWKTDIDNNTEPEEKQLDMVCAQFEIAGKIVEEEVSRTSHGFNIRELDWFSKHAHNMALSAMSKWPTRFTLRILDSCKTVRLTIRKATKARLNSLVSRGLFDGDGGGISHRCSNQVFVGFLSHSLSQHFWWSERNAYRYKGTPMVSSVSHAITDSIRRLIFRPYAQKQLYFVTVFQL